MAGRRCGTVDACQQSNGVRCKGRVLSGAKEVPMKRLICITATMALLSAGLVFVSATEAADPAVKCEAGKLKESSKYAACRLKADAKAVKKGIAADYTKCESKFADKWSKTETKAGPGVCPSEGDVASMDSRITTDAAEIATLLAGGTVANCGDGTVDAGEDCDFGDLGGEKWRLEPLLHR